MAAPIGGQSAQDGVAGVTGESTLFDGVRGVSHAPYHGGVAGINDNTTPTAGPGLYGESAAAGVVGISHTWLGVYGETKSPNQGAGVMGKGNNNAGVIGDSDRWHAVYGESRSPGNVGGAGVYGKAVNGGGGVVGESPNGIGVFGTGRIAGRFQGDVEVTGDIRLLNADCAEDFDIAAAESVDPGTVMVLAAGGRLRASDQAYDKRVAGIISGAGDYQPALVLDRQPTGGHRQPIALIGKVFCKVDAQYGPVEIGDLLTTSPTPGHAMKAADPLQAFGAVLGKALCPLSEGQSLIPVLVTLQ